MEQCVRIAAMTTSHPIAATLFARTDPEHACYTLSSLSDPAATDRLEEGAE